jgi:hypothetical protein
MIANIMIYNHLGWDGMYSGGKISKFQRNLLPPSSGTVPP